MMKLPGSRKLRRLFLAAALLLVCQPAFAEKRVALVLGNSAYQNVAPLPNPVNDGAVIAATLKAAGFDLVDSRHDLSAVETRRALRDFADAARDADIAVVYYAGHGMEVDGTNYLIPVDAKLERDTDVYDEALSLDRVLVAIDPAKQLRLVILDACRDNPFAKTMKRAGALAVAERAADRALELGATRALKVRGDVHKARGDRARALSDFEALADDLSDPALRLELAKLYEHFVKDPARALAVLEQGTGEAEPALVKRRARLERKARKSES